MTETERIHAYNRRVVDKTVREVCVLLNKARKSLGKTPLSASATRNFFPPLDNAFAILNQLHLDVDEGNVEI